MKTVPLGEVLEFAGVPERITQPASEAFVTVKLHGGGAVRRTIKDGKVPVAFTGYRVRAGQFIYSRIDARNGAYALIPEGLDGSVVTKDFPNFDLRREVIDQQYLIHFLRAGKLQSQVRAASFGATNRQRVAEDQFLAFRIPLPPLDEQRRTAAILDQADAVRAKRAQVQENLNGLARSIFVAMFGDPIRNPLRLPMVPLGELGVLDRGVSRHRPRNAPALLGGPYPLIQTGDVARSGGRITDYSATYSELGLAQSKLWPAGTLCITIAANIAQTGVLTFDACFPDSVVGFTADKVMTTYVRVWLNFLQPVLEASAPQSAQRNINLALLRALLVPLPERRALEHFDELVDRVQHEQQANQDLLEHGRDLFVSLQSRAFSGQL